MSTKKGLTLFLITSLLIIIFTPVVGNLYELYFGPISSGFWGPSHPEYIDGFFISYLFFVSLSVIIFAGNKKYKLWTILIGILLLIDLLLGAWESLIIDTGAVFVGWLFAQGILFIKKKIN